MAIFDTGIRADHPHFRNIKERTNWTNEDSLNDNLGHGTFVAGVIASQDMECLGFSPDSEIYAFRVFTDAQVSYTSWFLDAFNYAIATGINVLNLSIGGPDYLDRPFVEKVWEITANKIIMVSAIGNDGPLYGTLNNPADQNDVIGVGGIDYDDHIASFSSRGMSTWEIPHGYGRVKPDVVAYGRDIMGSKTSTGCKSLSGTSVASPVVAGVVCLLASVIPENIRWDILNPASMKQALVEGAAKLGGPNIFEQGAGRLDLLESYEILLKYRPRASILPSILDFTDCPYAWPFCRQPLYAGAMPVMFNATILNGMGVTGHVESEPIWHPFNEVGNLLNIHFTYSDVIWPWTGYLALHMQIKDEGAQFSGLIEGNVTFTVVSPPAKGETTPRRSICILFLKLQVIPTPPRSQRILWDQFHSIKYPPGYIPRDSLDVKNDILDWHGDHPHTNFHGMFDMLRDAGYYMEILGSPLTCFDASQYGTLLMVDLEDEFFKEEISKLENDVKIHGLGLLVFGDWYNVETMTKMRFFDDNTRSWWTPATGGANIPALNDLLKPFGIAFGDTILNGAFFLGGERSHYASGTDIAEFPAGGFLHNFSFQENFDGSTTQNVVQASGLAKVESSVLGVLEVGGGTGRIAVYGDSNCLDSSHMVVNCYWLLRKLLDFTSQNIRDPRIFPASNRLASPLIRNDGSFPARREDVNLSSYSLVMNHNLMCGNDARFEVWGAKGYNAETWRNGELPGIPSPFIIRQPMRSNPDTSQSIIGARPAIGNSETNVTAERETYHSKEYSFNATKDGFGIDKNQGLEQVGNHSLKIPLSKRNVSINISSRRQRAKMDLLGWLNRDELDVPTLVAFQWLVPVLLCITGFLLGLSFWRMRQRRRRRARNRTARPIAV
ncbi:subtilisin-like protease SBT6.1 isoform X2 [Cryptomeria japonica]|nr:subtilisin-like protease SBT6.1 isoform X2 [Cryptomeria japonica]XP_057867465.2 subtilisin-like protease SBT6.1 isoform X2 [Cryptomeria japonica]